MPNSARVIKWDHLYFLIAGSVVGSHVSGASWWKSIAIAVGISVGSIGYDLIAAGFRAWRGPSHQPTDYNAAGEADGGGHA